MIDWISVDDVLYRWDGQEIVCETGVGYSTRIEGNHLDGLEINDGSDNVSGRLFVDFAAGTLAYEPFDDQPSEEVLHYSLDGNETEVSLSQLPLMVALNDVLAVEDDADIWSSIANTSQYHVEAPGADVFHNPSDYVEHTALLDDGDTTLDLILQNIGDTAPVVAGIPDLISVPADFDSACLNSGLSDPLDSLHFYNAGGNGEHS
ncbi:hypothetical protein [Tolumonas auensis]|uniref:hypothetical protein n=1 Tax=Tolumonas auensis TaxID=43948 RepID=UPI002AA7C541|nr:hypothetical protein [Tolumonas auensis]